jgi:hypothetical protein
MTFVRYERKIFFNILEKVFQLEVQLNSESRVRRPRLSLRRRRREIALRLYYQRVIKLLDAYPTLTLRLPIIIEGFERKTMNLAIKTENLGRIYKIRGGKKD